MRIARRLEEIERRPVASRDRILDRRLEASAQVDDELGVADRLDVARRELDVVWLGARRREVHDLATSAPATRSAAQASG